MDNTTQIKSIINVMIVDDSSVFRSMLKKALEDKNDVNIVATAQDGKDAIEKAKQHNPDVVVLDIEMPVMDGLTALPHLLGVDSDMEIIVSSTLSHRNADISLKALEAGAADYLAKPTSSYEMGDVNIFNYQLVEKIRSLGQRVHQNRLSKKSDAVHEQKNADLITMVNGSHQKPDIIAIGSSTGGPQALFTLISGLKDRVEQPIVVTQHMPPTFTKMLAQHITKHSGIPCFEAEDGMLVESKFVYVAPGDYHLTFVKQGADLKIKLTQDPPVNYCRPAVDAMMRSLISIYEDKVLAVILTGMGADGENSCKELHNVGGTILAQDEESSVVWGMPGAVAKAGICSSVLPLEQLSQDIIKRAN